MLVPGLLFAALCGTRGGPCLDAYAWEAGVGYQPTTQRCDPDERPGLFAGAAFFGRATVGLLSGRGGRSREDASRPMIALLGERSVRSGAVVAVALLALALHAVASRKSGRDLSPPLGLPLPIAGFALFAAVVRLLPPDSPLDYDRAGLLWAGLALAWADGVGGTAWSGVRHASATERARTWARTVRLWGADVEAAVAEVSAPARSAQVRAAVLGLVGGLLVVEGIFGVNGLGETLRDLLVDRRGLDPLLLSGVLLAFSVAVTVLDGLPLERAVARWRT